MDIILTGTGSPLPDPDRAGPSTLVRAGDSHILIDAGRGVVMRLGAAGTVPSLLAGVCLTHLHSDHICALNDVITTHWIMSQGNAILAIWGPVGTSAFVEASLAALEPDIGYRLAHHEALTNPPRVSVTEVAGGDRFGIGDVAVAVADTEHAPVRPTVGYRFEHDGVVAALAGDTVPCAGLDDLCRGADVYVQSVIRDDLVRSVPNEMLHDIIDYHSTAAQAGQTAARAGVDTLVLTHMVPPPAPGTEDEWRAQAAAHFDGAIVIGPDLTIVSLAAETTRGETT